MVALHFDVAAMFFWVHTLLCLQKHHSVTYPRHCRIFFFFFFFAGFCIRKRLLQVTPDLPEVQNYIEKLV